MHVQVIRVRLVAVTDLRALPAGQGQDRVRLNSKGLDLRARIEPGVDAVAVGIEGYIGWVETFVIRVIIYVIFVQGNIVAQPFGGAPPGFSCRRRRRE